MVKTKTVRMPAGIRNKLMAAIAMLLVSSIMMVTSTYAWFTLSTAPEVTGITTSVGANGNLEIALLTTETYADLDEIKSAVGDSVAATGDVTESNITWGNLVDLSDASYGLNLIALNPAALNVDTNGNVLDTLLKTAEYGADGRVSELKDNTVSGIYDSATAKWILTEILETDGAPVQTQGVRAIGVDSSMTTAEIVLNAAKAAVNSGKNGAAAPISAAVNAYKDPFILLAMSMQDAAPSYDAEKLAALKAVAEGVDSSLKTIVKTYSNAVLAALAADENTTEDVLTTLRSQLSVNTSADALITLMGDAGADYTTRLQALADAQTDVAAVLGKFTVVNGEVGVITQDSDGNPVTVNVKEEIVKPLIGSSAKAFNAAGDEVTDLSMEKMSEVKSLYVSGGLVAVVAQDAGTYLMTTAYEIPIYASTTANIGNATAAGSLADVATTVAGLTPPDGGDAEKTIADFYGYVIDFAFRTNATESFLQLQTTPANRVYSEAEGENLVTQGAGSTATFAFDTGLNADQVQALLGAVRIVFLDPERGTVFAKAGLTNINVGDTTATADVKLAEQGEAANAKIVQLQQNTATRVSVLVYLDGEKVDNGDVSSNASSGMLNLNLQFSSSANLIPMQNTTLENMVLTYTELIDDDYKAGLYTYGGAVYTVKSGFKLYEGSDNMIYYSADQSTYTKLTAVNVATALEAVTVAFNTDATDATADNIITVGEQLDLSVTGTNITGATIDSVTWTSVDSTIATVTDADTTDDAAVVTGAAAGSTKIAAAVKLSIPYTDGEEAKTLTKTVNVNYPVTVTAAASETPANPDAGEGEGEDNTQQGGTTTTYNVTVPTGVNGSATATAGQDYQFTAANGYTLSDVAATVNGADVGVTAADGTYTIAGAAITGDIEITATATPAG